MLLLMYLYIRTRLCNYVLMSCLLSDALQVKPVKPSPFIILTVFFQVILPRLEVLTEFVIL